MKDAHRATGDGDGEPCTQRGTEVICHRVQTHLQERLFLALSSNKVLLQNVRLGKVSKQTKKNPWSRGPIF